ncbi:MAG: response regulator [Bacteroidota bacterium]|nr:response regulator [Bacteroidota bacterium]
MHTKNDEIRIGIICQHNLLRGGITSLLRYFGYCIQGEYNSGKEFIGKLNSTDLPNLVFTDVDRQETDAYETATYLKAYYPSIILLALTIEIDATFIDRLIKNGAKGVVLKTIYPQELELAIKRVITKGFYFPRYTSYKP